MSDLGEWVVVVVIVVYLVCGFDDGEFVFELWYEVECCEGGVVDLIWYMELLYVGLYEVGFVGGEFVDEGEGDD